MIIEENIKKTTFEEVNIGEVFRYGSTYFLKVPYCLANGASGFNSYDLVNNDYCYFDNDRKIFLVKAKLIIE